VRAYCVTICGMVLAMSLTVQSKGQSSGSSGQGSGSSPQSGSTPGSTSGSTPESTADTPSGSSSSGSGFSSPRLQPGDYLAPLSIMRWGPFSLNSIDSQILWSNQPLGLNGDVNSPAQTAGIPLTGATVGSHTAASMTARWRWGKGFVGVRYTPSMDYQTAIGQRQINHNVSAFIDHPFRIGKWRLTVGVHSSTTNLYSQFYQPPAIQPLLELEVPITTLDIIGFLSDPLPLQPVAPQMLLVSSRIITANASTALTRQITGRDSFSLAASYSLNQSLDFGNGSGTLFNYPKASGATVTAIWRHLISSRANWAISLSEGQSLGGGVYGPASQQTLQFTYSWRPWRRVGFSLGAGPARVRYLGTPESFQAAGSANIVYTVPGGSIFTAGYTKGFDLVGFAGPQQSQALNINWTQAPRNGRLGKWRYNVTTAVQLAGTSDSYNGVGSSLGSGFIIIGSLSYPVTQRLSFVANSGYLFQDISNTINNFPLQHFRRTLVSAGLHYSFGYPGQQRY